MESLSELPVQEDAYLAALQEGYTKLALKERALFDWVDAAEYAGRARAASGGTAPEPLDPKVFGIGGDVGTTLAEARLELRGYLASEGAMLRAGRQIGEAQVSYDCWVEEAEEGHQLKEITACRDRYALLILLVRDLGALPDNMAVVLPEKEGTIGGIEITQDDRTVTLDKAFAAAGTGEKLGDVPVTEGEIRDAFAGALAAQPPPPVEYTVTFDFNSSRIDDDGFLEIAKAAELALSRPVAEIIVTGYADAPGATSENLVLSRGRAARVRREVLRELGSREVTGPKIEVAATGKGEQGLLVNTGSPERSNRRVVILVR
ncbi:MAG: OmpA family protein [Paracoccaceae bacterium]